MALMYLEDGFKMLKGTHNRFSRYSTEGEIVPKIQSVCPLSGKLYDLFSSFARLNLQAATFGGADEPANFGI